METYEKDTAKLVDEAEKERRQKRVSLKLLRQHQADKEKVTPATAVEVGQTFTRLVATVDSEVQVW